MQDAVTPEPFEADAARLVLVEIVGRDRSGAQGADARDQDVPVSGVRPGGTPVSEPGQQDPYVEPAARRNAAGEPADAVVELKPDLRPERARILDPE